MTLLKPLLALAFASASTAAMGNYVGVLKPPQSGFAPGAGVYSFTSPVVVGLTPSLADPGYRLKVGFKTSRYFSVEGEYVDYGRPGASPFASPVILSSAFRSTGFGVDTVATLPFGNRFSLYGRLGAYRGDSRPLFAPYTTSLLADSGRGTRLRYGLGMTYDFTKAFGIRAEFERFSPLAHPLPTDTDSDQISVGVMWRF